MNARNSVEDEISARLVITGFDCDPDQITALLGIVPQAVWRKGDSLSFPSPRKRQDNGWIIESTIKDVTSLETHIAAILDLIGEAKQNFKALPEGSSVYLSCGIIVNKGPAAPSIVLEPKIVRDLAELGAGVGIDLYCLNCPDDEYARAVATERMG